MEKTFSIAEALTKAEATGYPQLIDRVKKAETDGWATITLVVEPDGRGGYDLGVAEPTGVMVAFYLDKWTAEEVAIPGGETPDQLHVTLAYLGDAGQYTLEQQRQLVGVVAEAVADERELRGNLEGTGRFVNGDPEDAFWVGVQVPGLQEFRQRLVTALTDAGFPPQGIGDTNKEYVPHCTVAYVPADQAAPALDFRPMGICVRSVVVAIGPQHADLKLQEREDDYPALTPQGWVPEAITKALDTVEEDRYTLGVWYPPNTLDAHGEWTDARELQKSFWGYLAKEDRDIRLQHNRDIVAGRWVDGMVMPNEHTVTLTKADGTQQEFTYPPGTPFLGVQWRPWAWNLVKAGKIRGYSIGGSSDRMLVDLPEPAATDL